jgi:hypothetical protein
MKKIVFLLAVTLAAGGMVWAQTPPPWTAPAPGVPAGGTDVFPGFDAVGVRSIEDKIAPGFDTMVENYIDPAFFDPNIGTFLFLSGNGGSKDEAFSLGVGKTLGSYYAAAFYKGSIIGQGDGAGVTDSNPDDKDKVYKKSYVVWDNSIALLFGIAGMGFRLDIIHVATENTVDNTTYDGNLVDSFTSGPRFALSWGSRFENLYPKAKIGIRFPDIESVGDSIGGADSGKKATKSSKGILNLEAAALYDFSGGNLTETVFGTLAFGLKFMDSYKGDTEVIGNLSGYDSSTGNGKEYDYGGEWGLKLALNYRKTFELGKFTLKITPNLTMTVDGKSQDYSIGDVKDNKPTWFTLEPGVTLGAKFQPSDKFAFFTGLDLSLLQWRTYATPGGDEDHKNDATFWELKGVQWNHILPFGMAWYPVKGLVVSADISGILESLFQFDASTMQLEFTGGDIFNDTQAYNIGDWAMQTLGKMFANFRLIVTYTF